MSPKRKTRTNNITFGKYVLDSLSTGMYSDPLMVIREYIQNSTDSIDLIKEAKYKPLINITIDGRKRSIEIFDNGIGIPSRKVRNTLLNIGASEKRNGSARGFRGIGRLGGLSYCDRLIFTTKSKGEKTSTSCVWDSKLLQQLVNSKNDIDTYSLIDKATNVKRIKYQGAPKDHFFKIQMLNIYDSRNDLLNVPVIRSYLSQVAPVPFHPDFNFGKEIDLELSKHSRSYRTYDIFLNNEQIFKPYRTTIELTKESKDKLEGIEFYELQNEADLLAFGWIGKSKLLGTVSPISGIDGVRLRCGNILIGNKDNLSNLFREPRFNHYLVGELHSIDKNLIPNSRRDDFEDSDTKGKLYNEILKQIGIPYSRKIRSLSKERGKAKDKNTLANLFEQASMLINNGYLSLSQKERIIDRLDNVNGSHSLEEVQMAQDLSHRLLEAQDVISYQHLNRKSKTQLLEILYKTFEIICSENPTSASLCNKLYSAILADK